MVMDNEQRSAAEAAYNQAKKADPEGLGAQLSNLMHKTKCAEIKNMCSVLIGDLAPARSSQSLHAEKVHMKEEHARKRMEGADEDEEDEEDKEVEKSVDLTAKRKELLRRFKS